MTKENTMRSIYPIFRKSNEFFRLSIVACARAISTLSPKYAPECCWVSSWMASPQPIWGKDFVFPTKIPLTLQNQTIRQIVRMSLGGSRFRLVFSNEYGEHPFIIGQARVALADLGSKIFSATDREITFSGKKTASVLPGASIISDPVELYVERLGSLSVSLFLPNATSLTTFHWDGKQTAYIGDGNLSGLEAFPTGMTTDARIFLSEVIVDAPFNHTAIVVLGDSITDGHSATLDANTRWPDFLAERLVDHDVAVLNAGISGATLLNDMMGVNASARFERDVIAKLSVKAVILLMGINDISMPGTVFAPDAPLPSANDLIASYQQLRVQAQIHKVKFIGATLPPFEGALNETPIRDIYSDNKETLRLQVNNWIRTSGAFDAIVDFDALLRDPSHPSRLLPEFDSGDHLHPNDLGNQVMAAAVDTSMLIFR